MQKIRLGKTNLLVSRSGFGALPIQRVTLNEASILLRKAYENGIDFFDTARSYSDSEEKIGAALSSIRHNIIIATKTMAKNRVALFEDLKISLEKLKTDYLDILQLHNPENLPDPDDTNSTYAGLQEAKRKGLIRFIGLTNHKLSVAIDAAASGFYDTIQFPLSTLSSAVELSIVKECQKNDCGLIAMKAMSGGLIKNAATSFAFLRQFDNVIPVWGIQKESELDQFLSFEKNPPLLDNAMIETINNDRKELSGQFCRGCGYCMPCPAGIEICWVARMSLLLRRAPSKHFSNDLWKQKMSAIKNCTGCGLCKLRCPYGLETPKLIKENLLDYETFFVSDNS
ncbi:MAG TPA: aldo/keto reductase [Chitinispirillaceae bacterium]|nr:aldo/keto reductase [Chitinispirillaceae bacterium]